ncbi:bifunctional phosphoribosyl-AMP cyclohydrolase/phosphoribosyl-ATP diphosphatase HisIE [Maricaulis sp. D1M11]|uniref:bifunctional phosphoribosyl-AMP cyclohydrolase/phosphoribosyl-ATP diphosphatase HisIE n=1 Tax=Maricaulis sp. D1M11 TaxID=3076117 RepID=UPI0039B4F7A3
MIKAKTLDWDKGEGLLPAIIQDATTLQVLMLGYMNKQSFKLTQETGIVHFYSRSRQEIWKKGATSGNTFKLVKLQVDCDNDTILAEVEPKGPACHLGHVTCFGDDPGPGLGFLGHLKRIIRQRREENVKGSYVRGLFEKAPKRPAQKVGEEGVEVAMAAVSESDEALTEEAADLVFHLMVLLESRDLEMEDVIKVLRKRHAVRAAEK